jgi:hypothetical protein
MNFTMAGLPIPKRALVSPHDFDVAKKRKVSDSAVLLKRPLAATALVTSSGRL